MSHGFLPIIKIFKKKHFSKLISMRVLILTLFFWEKNVLGHIGIFWKKLIDLKKPSSWDTDLIFFRGRYQGYHEQKFRILSDPDSQHWQWTPNIYRISRRKCIVNEKIKFNVLKAGVFSWNILHFLFKTNNFRRKNLFFCKNLLPDLYSLRSL